MVERVSPSSVSSRVHRGKRFVCSAFLSRIVTLLCSIVVIQACAWPIPSIFLHIGYADSMVSRNEPAQAQVADVYLNIDKPIEKEIAAGQTHSYRISLNSRQYLYLNVSQRGVDVSVEIVAPDGESLLLVDSVDSLQGTEKN